MTEVRPEEVAAYTRVSSRSQDLATQRAEIERMARARRDVIGAWYEEKVSAKSLNRPALTQLRTDVHEGRVRRVYVYKLDRLVRTGVRDMFAVVDGFLEDGAELLTVKDTLDFSNALSAKLMLAILAICAEVERANIGERISDARRRVEAAGGHWGRAPRLEGESLARARQLRAKGRTIREIAVALKVPKSSVQRSLAGAVPKTPESSASQAPSGE